MRVAIIGCGHISEQHVRTLKRIRGVNIVSVCDRDLNHAQLLAQRHGIEEAYDNIEDMLTTCQPDVVHILTPPQSHLPIALQAVEAGSNLLIEKPLALNAQDAIEIVRAAKQYSASVSICHNFLYMPAMQRALRLVREGTLGKVISAEVYWRISSLEADSRPDAHSWVEALPGGAFHEVGPHVVYLLRAILGELEVTAASYAGDDTMRDELRVQLSAGDKLGAMTISWNETPIQKYIRIFGTRMSLHVDLGSNVLVKLRSWGKNMPARALLNFDHAAQLASGTAGNIVHAMIGKMPRSHPRFIQAYYKDLQNNQPVYVSGEDGVAVTKVLDQIWITAERTGS